MVAVEALSRETTGEDWAYAVPTITAHANTIVATEVMSLRNTHTPCLLQ